MKIEKKMKTEKTKIEKKNENYRIKMSFAKKYLNPGTVSCLAIMEVDSSSLISFLISSFSVKGPSTSSISNCSK